MIDIGALRRICRKARFRTVRHRLNRRKRSSIHSTGQHGSASDYMVDAVRMQGAVRVPHGEVDTLADEFVAAHIEQIALAVDGFEGFVWKADGGGGS